MFRQTQYTSEALEQGMSEDEIVSSVIDQFLEARGRDERDGIFGAILSLIDPKQVTFNLKFIEAFAAKARSHLDKMGHVASLVSEIAIMKIGRAEDITREQKKPFIDRAMDAIEAATREGKYDAPVKALESLPDLITSNLRVVVTPQQCERAFTILRNATQGCYISDDEDILHNREESDIIACGYRMYNRLHHEMNRKGMFDENLKSDPFHFVQSRPDGSGIWAYSDPYQQRLFVELEHREVARLADAVVDAIDRDKRKKRWNDQDDLSPESLIQLGFKAYDAELPSAAHEMERLAPIALADKTRRLFKPETLQRLQSFMPSQEPRFEARMQARVLAH